MCSLLFRCLIGPFVQEGSVWNFGQIEVEIHMEHSDIRRRLSYELDISCTSTTAESRAKIWYQCLRLLSVLRQLFCC